MTYNATRVDTSLDFASEDLRILFLQAHAGNF